jgi:hypothetical protein
MRVISSNRPIAIAAALASATVLAGCYVMPVQPPAPAPAVIHVPAPAPATPVTFTARLYPSNDLAARHGIVGAVVTNDLNGRGHFSTNIGGESFTGEATRDAGSSTSGIANGAGNRGGYIHCRYTMNSTTLGTGSCRMSSGATFSMHVGQ